MARPVLIVQAGLVALAGFVALAPGGDAIGVLAACVLVAALLWYLWRMAAGKPGL